MNQLSPYRESVLRRRPLAVCIASLFSLAAPAAMAANRPVTSCLDDGSPGTLRSVVASPSTVSGDTVDLSALACAYSKITLDTGGSRILVPQASLTIKGPGAAALAIDGSALASDAPNTSNVFEHTGNGTLAIKYLSVTGGHKKQTAISARGGCIFSNGSVTLDGAEISSCSAQSAEGAEGGGIWAQGDLLVVNSTVSGNSASSAGPVRGGGLMADGNVILLRSRVSENTLSSGGRASGGGIYTYGDLTAIHSTVHANSVTTSNPSSDAVGGGAVVGGDFASTYATISDNHLYAQQSDGGGLALSASATIFASTISGNSANLGGGIQAYSSPSAGHVFLMRNSTVSGNSAANMGGGIFVNAATTKFYNSTIAFNTAANAGPGVRLSAFGGPMDVTLQSTLMSDNVYTNAPIENDLAAAGPTITFNQAPANNLINVTGVGGLPSDTLFLTCPLLGPLRDNGGPTKTHALSTTSPAIDAGNNASIDPLTQLPYASDQRGLAADNGEGVRDYVRVSGTSADIGAYEVQQNDVVFNAGFEGCL